VLALDQQSAGALIPLYWFGALIGRFIGSAVLRLVDPARALVFNAACVLLLIAITTQTTGHVAAGSLLAIGVFNSIMFPTIFTLASERLGDRAADGSGVLCVAIVGGAVIPPLTGKLADLTGSLEPALMLPALCYAVIGAFGWYARKPGTP